MNTLQTRLANTSHVLVGNCGRAAATKQYQIGEQLRVKQDVDLQVDEGLLSVPEGTIATVTRGDGQHLELDLGERLGSFAIPQREVGQFFERAQQNEWRQSRTSGTVTESGNPVIATPGAYVQVTRYDPTIGPNRGPKSPGFGGYQTLVGQKGMIATLFGVINGIKTYKVQLMQGGEFVLGETEFTVITGVGTQESIQDQPTRDEFDHTALMGLGLGL